VIIILREKNVISKEFFKKRLKWEIQNFGRVHLIAFFCNSNTAECLINLKKKGIKGQNRTFFLIFLLSLADEIYF